MIFTLVKKEMPSRYAIIALNWTEERKTQASQRKISNFDLLLILHAIEPILGLRILQAV